MLSLCKARLGLFEYLGADGGEHVGDMKEVELMSNCSGKDAAAVHAALVAANGSVVKAMAALMKPTETKKRIEW